MISETKIDESFPKGNFLIDGFSTPYRIDRDSKGGDKPFLLNLTCKIRKY